jgi:CRP/FNR family cyclic AMP-dependent transcriptional regulator
VNVLNSDLAKKPMTDSLLNRFRGPEGRRRLIDALRAQQLVANEEEIASSIADSATLRELSRGNTLIAQDASDNDAFLIVSGEFSVLVHGRPIARRKPGQHIGEMALIDPGARRSASVVALADSVVACITEVDFTRIANRFPQLWRRAALELADRLRQRNALVQERRNKPVVFIGSSRESVDIAIHIRDGLPPDKMETRIWTDWVFGASSVPIEALESQIMLSDFAILVLGPDDKVTSRGDAYDAPRDNIIFEIGLFMGSLGRKRTFMVKPRGSDLKIPTDLLGVIPIECEPGPPRTLAKRLATF